MVGISTPISRNIVYDDKKGLILGRQPVSMEFLLELHRRLDLKTPELTESQWEFLAVLAVFDQPVQAGIMDLLAPLTAGPLFELLEGPSGSGPAVREGEAFRLSRETPLEIKERLEAVNSPERLNTILTKLMEAGLWEEISYETQSRLESASGRFHLERAVVSFHRRRQEESLEYLELARERLRNASEHPEENAWLIDGVIELNHRIFMMGRGLKFAYDLDALAINIAEKIGDQRKRAILKLYQGIALFYTGRPHEAFTMMEAGKAAVDRLGDDDIQEQSAELVGHYYFFQGRIREAVEWLDRAVLASERKGSRLINPYTPITLGYAEAFAGLFHRAVGGLEYRLQQARRGDDRMIIPAYQTVLGFILLLIGKRKEGSAHIDQAYQDAVENMNQTAVSLAAGAKAYGCFLEGDLDHFRSTISQVITKFTNPYITMSLNASSWTVEAFYEFHRRGRKLWPGWNFSDLSQRILGYPNILLRGVVLRLQARDVLRLGGDPNEARRLLAESEKNLAEAGDPVQLGKTHADMARLELLNGNREEAERLAARSRQGLSGVMDDHFPDELRVMLRETKVDGTVDETSSDQFIRLLEAFKNITAEPGRRDALDRLVTALNRSLMAERGALFWFTKGVEEPELRAARNLTAADAASESFRPRLALIKKALKSGRPVRFSPAINSSEPGMERPQAILCLPVRSAEKVSGVLYFDNSYLDDCFEFASDPLLGRVMELLTKHVENILLFQNQMEEVEKKAFSQNLAVDDPSDSGIIYQSQAMKHVMLMAGRVAQTSASVLILGETGSGKEMLARWIHRRSPYKNGRLVVVDPTAMPENLMESELFGHEKGAFTGAYKQRPGKLELAHHGTLFIDEIGEIPLSLQPKFLRALQEKTFTRVGGAQEKQSEFRLLTATNRDLAGEVRQGRFREDLFFRINVMEITLPPLRIRSGDIIALARHFLEKYARKYGRAHLSLSDENQKALLAYSWPGNVRELGNVIERSVLMSPDDQLGFDFSLNRTKGAPNIFEKTPTMDELQRQYIYYLLEKTGGRIGGEGGVADILGLKRTTLISRMERLGITKKQDG